MNKKKISARRPTPRRLAGKASTAKAKASPETPPSARERETPETDEVRAAGADGKTGRWRIRLSVRLGMVPRGHVNLTRRSGAEARD
jgi:hypothetical protein